LHNLYSLRGAKVRDATKWVYYLTESINLFGHDAQVEFASHHWPTWGNQNIVNFLESQRDTYKYIHDQTLRLANEGYTMNEIAEQVKLPESLSSQWYNRGYYGTVSHDVKAVYQQYLGWFDGNPAHLNPLPDEESAKKYVEYMGGENAILAKAQKDYDAGNYRWVAEVLNKVVFANPANQPARDLLADTYEQLGYQAESAPWRNFYLTGAQELREGVKKYYIQNTVSPDIIQAMTMPMMLDYLAIRVNGPKADGQDIRINLEFPDIHENYALHLKNAVLNYQENKLDSNADVTVKIDRKTLNALALNQTTIIDVIKQRKIQVIGNKKKLIQFFGLIDKFDFWFNIVTP
jgi:alkyl sulfatase BDS1-like metallo-beta-lactamase superfamily hydrolase